MPGALHVENIIRCCSHQPCTLRGIGCGDTVLRIRNHEAFDKVDSVLTRPMFDQVRIWKWFPPGTIVQQELRIDGLRSGATWVNPVTD